MNGGGGMFVHLLVLLFSDLSFGIIYASTNLVRRLCKQRNSIENLFAICYFDVL